MTQPTALQKFNEEVLSLALSKLDKEKISTKLAKELEKTVARDMKNWIDNNIDMGEWLLEEINDGHSKIGANFAAAMDDITMQMIASITPDKNKK